MKALTAIQETQGRRKNDFCFCNEGEFVTYGFECDRETVDGHCGCKRALCGFDSSKATTTFRVVTVDLTEERLSSVMRDRLTREGWISPEHTAAENESFLDGQVRDTLALWSGFAKVADGTIVERRGTRFYSRLRQPTAPPKPKSPTLGMLHNIAVVQSKAGWKYEDVQKAIADAKAGILYAKN